MRRRRRRAPASTLRASLAQRMREKDEWSSGVFDYDDGERTAAPFFLVALLQQMHRYLLVKIAVAVVVVLVAALLYSGNYAWGRPLLEALQFVVSWDMDLEALARQAAPAFRTVWNNWDYTGANKEEKSDMVLLPLNGNLISGYGMRLDPRSGREQMHYGIDLGAPEGTPVLAVLDGVVLRVEVAHDSGENAAILLEHDGGWQTFYRGLGVVAVKEGDTLKAGAQLGFLGSASLWDTPHLHFELRHDGRPVEPAPQWLEQYREPAI